MVQSGTLGMLAFHLKMLGRQTQKNVLISAGQKADKERMLPYVRELADRNVAIYATDGTHVFFRDHGLESVHIRKIADAGEPNIRSFLRDDRFDLVINILTGNHDYDEQSDANLIRSLSIENGIPLITDPDVAIATIQQVIDDHDEGKYRYRLADPREPWNMTLHFMDKVREYGGFACHHAHFDKAYLISMKNLELGQKDMQEKWKLYKYLKENYTHEDLVERISRGLEKMIDQGASYCRTMVDADSTVKTLPIDAALDVKERYRDQIDFEIGIQPLQGIRDIESRKYYTQACEKADFIGGLPSRDRPLPEKHLDYILDLARSLDKRVDVHVDQENNPDEDETEMLALKTMEHGLEGRVYAVHAISLGAKEPLEQDRIIRIMKDAGVGVIVCPSAAVSMKQLDRTAPLHNSIAPVPRLLAAGVPLYLGVDNIHDLFMPLVDGDMWFECRLLMEACRHYDVDAVARIATARLPKTAALNQQSAAVV